MNHAEINVSPSKGLTLEEIAALPAAISMDTFAKAFGVSRAWAYAHADELPVTVVTVGRKKRVITASLVRLLSGEQS